jgi:putative Holliday junction resolvase
MRALGVDLGTRRIGLAISDSAGKVATPVGTIFRSGDRGRDHQAIAEAVAEWGAEAVVVGLPLSLDGSVGVAAQAVLDEVTALSEIVDVGVNTVDERFSTVTAARQLQTAGMRGRKQRNVVDQAAAAVLLQAWLDQRGT